MGAYLRAARRRRRVSIERAAEETKIRADYLMRMESDEFDWLSPAYVRGFLKSYCNYLGIVTEPMLKEFDRRFGTGRLDTATIVALDKRNEVRMPRQKAKLNSWTVAAALAGGALVLLALVGLFSPSNKNQSDNNNTVATTTTPTIAEASPTPSPSVTPSLTPSPSPSALLASGPIDLKVSATRDRCWVQVYTDNSSTVTYTGTLEIGQQHSFSANETMTVLLGNARGVDLIVNGQNIGSPGGTVKTIKLPEDIKSLL
jgi:cytoskeletal protein RodZ